MHYSPELIIKRLLYFVALIGAVIAFSVYWNPEANIIDQDLTKDPKNTTYIIEGQPIYLKDGYAEIPVENSSSKMKIKYFGNEVAGDFDGDNIEDKAFLLTSDNGGSGTFYYLAVAIQDKDNKYNGLNAIFLGDRIAPQTTEFRDRRIIVNFATRQSGEPMTASPSLGVSKYFQVRSGLLFEIVNSSSDDVVLNGRYICLPHKGNGEFQTLECAFGIKDNNSGSNYALDLNQMHEDFAMNIVMDKDIEIIGNLTPIELLSSDHYQKYDVAGIITVRKETRK